MELKEGQKTRNLEGRVTVETSGFVAKDEKEWFLRIQDYWDKGYRIAENFRQDDFCTRNFSGMGRVVMYKDGDEFLEDMAEQESGKKTTPLDLLSELKTKAEFLAFAEEHKIKVPEDIKMPKAVQKYIKENLM